MIRRSIALSALETYVGILIQLASSVVLARLLTPTQIGVFATAAAFAAFAGKIRDFGMSEYLIQLRAPTSAQVSAVFTMNLIVTGATVLCLVASSWTIAMFFGDDDVGRVLRIQAIAYLALPFGAIHLAWHHRNMTFQPIVYSGIASNLVSAMTSVSCAYNGLGTMSLAWGAVGGSAASVLVAILTRDVRLRPRVSLHGLKDSMRFGAHVAKIFAFAQVGRSAPELLIAKLGDFASVAYFSRAAGMVEIFNQSVLRVVSLVSLPALAMAEREGAGRLSAFERGQAYVTCIGWAFFGVLGLLAEPAVAILYGDQWAGAVPLVRVLCAVAAVELGWTLARDLLLSAGLAKSASRVEAGVQVVRVACLSLIVPWGAFGAAIGLLVAAVINASWVIRVLKTLMGLDVGAFARSLAPGLGVALLCALPAVAWNLLEASTSGAGQPSAVAVGAACGVVWIGAVWLTNHPLRAELQVLVRRIRGR